MSAKAQNSTISSAHMARSMILGQLYTNEIVDKRVLHAFEQTQRELFVPETLRGAAYVDNNLDVGGGRSLLAPLTFGRLLTLAEITPDARILDIGCLTGYSTAMLAQLGGHIVAVDTDASAISKAKELLKPYKDIDLQLVKSLADGYGMSAPYDVIVIEGTVDFIPDVLARQLSENGCIVTVMRKSAPQGLAQGTGKGMLIKRLDGILQYREHFDAAAELLPGFEQKTGFTL